MSFRDELAWKLNGKCGEKGLKIRFETGIFQFIFGMCFKIDSYFFAIFFYQIYIQ